jgi:putative thioredoxin
MGPEYIIDINDENFEYEVIQYSLNTPVVLDFWAEWCKPCKTLSPMLESLAHEAGGGFRLAKVNVDHSPNIALRFGVRSIPTIKAFTQGEVVGEVVGLQPEPRLREFINRIIPPSPLTLSIEKANGLIALRQWVEAEELLHKILELSPENPVCLLGLAKVYLVQKRSDAALQILRRFPPSRFYAKAEILMPLAETQQKIARGAWQIETDLDQAFTNSINLASRGNLAAALDGLLDVLRENKGYKNGLARQVFLGILEIMGEDDVETREYRNELASILF